MVDLQDNAPSAGAFPTAWEFDALLMDGRAIRIRPIRGSDAPRLIAFHRHLSPESIYHRYFRFYPELSENDARRDAEVDYRDRMCFIAELSADLVGFASYERLSSDAAVAEIGFCIADEVQHRGAATLLFESLAAYARLFGINRFVAEVMSDNIAMLDVFGASGLESRRMQKDGTWYLDISLNSTRRFTASCDTREAIAEAASMTAILQPASIAVVGASRRPGNVGHEIVRSLLAGDFAGTVYPVNPHADAICGVPAWPTLSSIPRLIDLVIVAVHPTKTRDVVKESAAIGARGVVIVSAGFGETGLSGEALEGEVLEIARRSGMRVVGPNCLGVVNTDDDTRMNATFVTLDLLPGPLALISQSGALGLTLAQQARSRHLGLSIMVSIGNKLDVSSNDILCFLERDERTSIIALYLESFGNPRKFGRIASRIGRTKPIVALTAGRSSAGVRGARSHTAAAATSDVVVTALMNKAGVIKVDRLEELLDVSSALLTGRLPKGNRVALVGNSGGPLILAADACESHGLIVPEFSADTQAILRDATGPTAAVGNPVDLTADGTAEGLEQSMAAVVNDDSIDSLVVVITGLPMLSPRDVRSAVEGVAAKTSKPVLLCILGDLGDFGGSDETESRSFAEIGTPERAATALAYVSRYAEWRALPSDAAPDDLKATSVSNAVVATLLDHRPSEGWLALDEAARLLQSCGIPMLPTLGADDVANAIKIADSVGYPVALKARAGTIVHKSDVGGVALGLRNAEEVRDAYVRMEANLGPRMGGAVIQQMAPNGVEAIVGVATDPSFGPVVMVGLGGILTDLLGDRAFAVPPLDESACDRMVSSLRASPLLDGYRGAAVVDRAALVHVVRLVSQLADEVPELAELDLNPVVVHAGGAVVVDCKLRFNQAPVGPSPLFRALRARR
ncbi:MAG: GNAT family N-acetyltransferase [Acidimicrobiales bacterium]